MRLSAILFVLSIPAALLAQTPPAAGGGAGATTPTNPGGGGGGLGGNTNPTNPGGLGGNNPTNPGRSPFPGQDPMDRNRFPDMQQNRPIFISGKVMLADGTPPPDSVTIERVCNGTVRPEGYTNSKGHFSIELGRNNAIMADASTSGGLDDGLFGRSTMGGNRNTGFGGQGAGISERDLMGCEIRANLPGFRADVVNLSGRRFMDNPDIGTIILHRLANVEGFTFSMTTAMAPKEAKKSYEKGLDLIKKKKLPEALVEIEKATAAYPKYAIAWFDQGRLYEMQQRPGDAQKAFEAAIAADPKYVKPYVNLAMIHGTKKDWEKTAEVSAKGIKLNPFEYPQLHYVNAVSNLNLGKLDDAEKSATEAGKLDSRKQLSQLGQLLGAISSQRKMKVTVEPAASTAPPQREAAPPPPPPTVSARTSWPSWSNGISDLPPGTLSKNLDGAALWNEVGNSVYALVTAGDASQLKPEASEFQGAAVAVSNTLLLTNCDVLENTGSTGLYQNGKLITTSVRLIKAKRAAGLCVLEVGGTRLQPVNGVRYAQDLAAGEKTFTVRAGTLAEGALQSAKTQGNIKLLVSNAPVSAATAGGGLFDSMGNLIGVTTLRSQTAVIAVEEFYQ